MKFGLGFPFLHLYPPTVQPWEEAASTDDIVAVARRAEAAGFDYLSVSDHLLMSVEMAEAMGPRWSEGVTAMAFLAGATTDIQVYTSVLVLPYRNPLLLAKQISTLDFMSGGRVVLGVGIGHLAKEFELLGVSRPDRAAITDEYLQAIDALFTQDRPVFEGKFVSFDGVVFEPKPVRAPHLPVWVGGNSPAALRRAARFGDGWVPWQITSDELPASIDALKSQPGYREPAGGFDVVMPLTIIQREEGTQRVLGETVIPDGVAEWTDAVGANAEAGATVSSVSFGNTRTVTEFMEKIDEFAEEVAERFR